MTTPSKRPPSSDFEFDERRAFDPDTGPGGPDSSELDEDDELDRALDSFLDWADDRDLLPEVELPELTQDPIARGTVLGDFELARPLGAGSMGLVYEAQQRSIPGRTVAIKVMRTVLLTKKLRERFRREVAVVGHLDHPHIVPVLAAGIEKDLPYYAMKLVDGASAAELLDRMRERNSTPTLEAVRRTLEGPAGTRRSRDAPAPVWETTYVRWAARCCLNIADALQHAHDQGIVHRDIKPGNVMLTRAGRPMLMDFGLASDASDVTLTRSGDFLGTMAYASPEQVRGDDVDPRSDIFSLGAMLYELLSLRRPFPSTSRSELLHAIEFRDPPPLDRSIPADLRTICMHALAKAPGKRYRTCAALANDLREFLEGRPIQARPPSLVARMARGLRRHPRVLAVAAVTLMLVAGLAARDRWRARACVADARAAFAACMQEARTAESVTPGLLDRFREVESELLAAFRYVPTYAPARAALADLHAAELRLELGQRADVLAPRRVRELEQKILLTGDESRFGPLLSPRGWVQIESDPPGARVRLWRDDPDKAPGSVAGTPGGAQDLLEGETPQRFDDLPEGSYFAELEAPGRLTTRAHLLVRRATTDADEPHPSRYVRVRLPLPEEARPGYRYIPAGWSFVGDDPPEYVFVDAFWIRELETTFAEWVDWMNALEEQGRAPWIRRNDPSEPDWKPRLGAEPSAWEVRRDADGRWAVAPGVDPSWPVRGLKATEMYSFATTLDIAHGEVRKDTAPSLPTRAQLVRAARGADARAYPWGNTFDAGACANYLSRESWGREPFPHPVGRFPGDVSPFGVRDLAGSIREATRSPGGPLRGEIAVCFGSYRTTDERHLQLTRFQSESPDPIGDVGFRHVLNPWPEWCRRREAATALHDDFERPDSDEVGAGWQESSGELFDQDYDPLSEEQCSVRAGKLVVSGGVGNFSELSTVWYPIAEAASGYRVAALVAAHCADATSTRTVGLQMRTHPRGPLDHKLMLSIDCGGAVHLQRFAEGETTGTVSTEPGRCELGRWYWLQLEAHPGQVRAWVSPAEPAGSSGGPADRRPAPFDRDPDLELPPEDTWTAPRFLTLLSACAVGARIEVDEIEWLPLRPDGR